jgi:hypothetical protein
LGGADGLVTEHLLHRFECYAVFERHGGRKCVACNMNNFSKSK